ncbi:septum site-determining protein MinC [Oxobacter pfennigii]|uniref:Probable septum site-determining protein MinC n=1 Tax=Oxobacter pfennigii TaxID=36849 RepID=A0A0P8WVH5_9CLOT|nr:septum site-determining protein MinC [Oxobacter pfennigii]KPU42244.1 septum site-determining protein MinC [Oxobacter pfennigii]
MENENVVFKGTKDGVIVKVKGQCDLNSIVKAIGVKLDNSKDFFRSGNIFLDMDGFYADEIEEIEIKKRIYESYGVKVKEIERSKPRVFDGINEGNTKFIVNTIRSGQNIESSENIVIIGDVNAGAHIKAAGNIIILGTLRGVVHAGATGNEKAIIAAFSLQPVQLRIADLISRHPDGEVIKPKCPELACVRDSMIIIEPYVAGKFI